MSKEIANDTLYITQGAEGFKSLIEASPKRNEILISEQVNSNFDSHSKFYKRLYMSELNSTLNGN